MLEPLEALFVRDVTRKNITILREDFEGEQIAQLVDRARAEREPQVLYPVVDAGDHLAGVVSRSRLQEYATADRSTRVLDSLLEFTDRNAVTAYNDEPLRVVVYRMAETGRTHLRVLEGDDDRRVVGMISLKYLLKARTLNLQAEGTRERHRTPWRRPRARRNGDRTPSS